MVKWPVGPAGLGVGAALATIFILAIINTSALFAYSLNIQVQALQSLKAEFNATDAIIKSPAVIIELKTLSGFNAKRSELNAQVYYYENAFYLVPDSYLGYTWMPKILLTGWGGWELTNP